MIMENNPKLLEKRELIKSAYESVIVKTFILISLFVAFFYLSFTQSYWFLIISVIVFIIFLLQIKDLLSLRALEKLMKALEKADEFLNEEQQKKREEFFKKF